MSLLEMGLYNIHDQIQNNILEINKVDEYLPEDLTDELREYINAEDTIEKFYISLKYKHFYIADQFLSNINDNVNIINKILAYCCDIAIADYLISKGAYNFEEGLLIAVLNNNMKMINYFICKGAYDFDAAMNQAILTNNFDLIKYFISIGANDWRYGLYFSAKIGNHELSEFFINIDVNNLITENVLKKSLAVALEYGHFHILNLLCNYDENNLNNKIVFVGDAFLYFIRHAGFRTISGIDISILLPHCFDGYLTMKNAIQLLKLYSYNNLENGKYNVYFEAFKHRASMHQYTDKKLSTFRNIKIKHKGFCDNFVDELYFSNIVRLNSRVYNINIMGNNVNNEHEEQNRDIIIQINIEEQIVGSILSNYRGK
jgi:hypothetical protein